MNISSALALTATQGELVAFLQSLHGGALRAIGPYTAHVTENERHEDRLVLTENPVEYGADITDHSYKLPALVTIEAGWSGSPPINQAGLFNIPGNITQGLAQTAAAFGPGSDILKEMYQGLLSLQLSRRPFTVWTTRRFYENMLITSLFVETDLKRSNVLRVRVECKEVILVQTTLTTVPDAANMLHPEQNSVVVNVGQQALNPNDAYSLPQLSGFSPTTATVGLPGGSG